MRWVDGKRGGRKRIERVKKGEMVVGMDGIRGRVTRVQKWELRGMQMVTLFGVDGPITSRTVGAMVKVLR
jgi:hypothetical protein